MRLAERGRSAVLTPFTDEVSVTLLHHVPGPDSLMEVLCRITQCTYARSEARLTWVRSCLDSGVTCGRGFRLVAHAAANRSWREFGLA
jgi:hypothetical protein